MRIRLISVGSKMPGWVEEGYREYSRRLGADVKLELVEIPLGKRSKGSDINRLQEKEAGQMLAAVGSGDLVVTMEIMGKAWSTEKLADNMERGCTVAATSVYWSAGRKVYMHHAWQRRISAGHCRH